MPDALTPLPFAEAIAFARERQVVLPEVYYGELIGLARAQAFTVSGLAGLDQISAVRDALAHALAQGETFATWRAALDPDTLGALGAAQTETVWRNNVQQSYNRGRCEQQARTTDSHPYWMYDAVNDSRTRPTHAAMDGHVARHDDPIWATWTPACGHRCRCRRIALSARQAERYVIEDAERMGEPLRAQARANALAVGPDAGWGSNIYEDPTRGLKEALATRQAQCGPGGQMGAQLARAKGGCLAQADRLLRELRERLDAPLVDDARVRVQTHLGVAAQMARSAERFQTLWQSPSDYRRHLNKRMDLGEVADADDYRRQIMRTLDEASVLLLGDAAGQPAQIAVESTQWAIIYRDDAIATAYPLRDDAESFIAQRRRLGWTLAEVPLDDTSRTLLRQLRAYYGRL